MTTRVHNTCLSTKRTGWDSNPRGREPTRFPIVRLKPLGHPSHETDVVHRPGVGWTSLRSARPHWVKSLRDFTWVRIRNHRRPSFQRREWDSNPRGP